MWISKDMHGTYLIWKYKPELNELNGNFEQHQCSPMTLRRIPKTRINPSLRKGTTRKVKAIRIELEDKDNGKV